MSHVLFMTQRMMRGFGVDVAVHNVGMQLRRLGHDVTIACVETDGTYRGLRVVRVPPEPRAIENLATSIGASLVVAHTTPFFELLPALKPRFACWAWEYGDPTPELFSDDCDARARVKTHKQQVVYPATDGVLAISEFIRADIAFPEAHVVYLGCDHVPDLGSKGLQDFPAQGARPLRVGTLMRLGDGEARYKGNALFGELADRVRAQGIEAQFCVMGRGTKTDAEIFSTRGFEVHLNASDEEKWCYLRGLDVFVSCSLWEGFNLPLVEALASGTVAMAFDTGAHGEVTPFVLSSLSEGVELMSAYAENRALLISHSQIGYRYVRARFRWVETALAFQEIARLRATSAVPVRIGDNVRNCIVAPVRINLAQVRASLRAEGVVATALKISKRIGRWFGLGRFLRQ